MSKTDIMSNHSSLVGFLFVLEASDARLYALKAKAFLMDLLHISRVTVSNELLSLGGRLLD